MLGVDPAKNLENKKFLPLLIILIIFFPKIKKKFKTFDFIIAPRNVIAHVPNPK